MNTLPSIFVSHGAPTFAIEPGLAGAQLRALGKALGKPRAVLIVSPHWMTRGVEITATARPETIHDFGGFPRALYAIQYPAPGAPELGARAAQLLHSRGIAASLEERRGLDHGAWVPLLYLYPDADVPVVQASIPFDMDEAKAFELGRALAPLAEEYVLIVGSGSLTHNLYEFRMGQAQEEAYAAEFSAWIRQAVLDGDTERLVQALQRAPHAARAHPTTEHFLPLLVAAGAAATPTPATVLDGGIRHGVLAMESYVFGRHVPLDVEEAGHA
ncbi:DODA-type extradiol aromatic ring-opening family dioxygenase [Caldimonas tepidiphila]|uniref:DODA-type extradiol aromatic ring-opening family dioxygenase n=1 Tax=Caldimonas tepidiphila TaxID=2315841 RepID=UPI000E5B2F90|nr:class III extradiol ring-cleavage dioxygenase [Caldimonas tepidiphila]